MAYSRHLLLKQYSWKCLFILPTSLLAFATLVNFMFIYSISYSALTPLKITPTIHTSSPRETIRSVHENRNVAESINGASGKIGMMQRRNITCQGLAACDEVAAQFSRLLPSQGNKKRDNDDVFHDRKMFTKEYNEMNKSLKIYAYPHNKDDPFANVLLPDDELPVGGNYASESYFKKSLFKSHFLTDNPSEAHLFYLPFSIASLRHDKRIGVGGIQDFVSDYIVNISRSYPFWNRSGGADHFYVACHSVGRSAMDKAVQVKLNAIQVVCSSSYFLGGYVSHKDASIPQIWPRKGVPPNILPSQRNKLAFYAGAMNSRVRKALVDAWENDSQISVHSSRLRTPYSESLLGSKFCIHAKGFEVNTARIGDAFYYGCVPVVLADHYDLPYNDILNWNTFSVVVATMDIPMLKKILEDISLSNEYLRLQRNVMRVRKHFQWHQAPVEYDAFHMVMKELWLRKSHVRINII